MFLSPHRSRGKKHSVVLRTQLTVRVHACIGEHRATHIEMISSLEIACPTRMVGPHEQSSVWRILNIRIFFFFSPWDDRPPTVRSNWYFKTPNTLRVIWYKHHCDLSSYRDRDTMMMMMIGCGWFAVTSILVCCSF